MYREHAHYLRGLPRGVSPVRLPRSAEGTPNVINVPMLTINFADDLINPPELLNLPTASNFTEVMIPSGPASYGHMTLAHPAVWASALGSFLQRLRHER